MALGQGAACERVARNQAILRVRDLDTDFANALAMTFFRSLVIGILGAILLLQLQHMVEHIGHEHALLHQAAHSHTGHARLHTGAGEVPTWRRARPAHATEPTASRVTPITADTALVDIERSSLQHMTDHDLLAQARMVPTLHQGRVQGLRFYAVRPGSLLAALGVQNGDIMLSVNGRSMSRPECAPPELIAAVFGNPPDFIDIQLLRAGQPVRVVVLVHERPHAPEAQRAQASAQTPS